MKKLLPFVVVLAAGILVAEVVAQGAKYVSGVIPSNRYVEQFDMSVGLSGGGRPLRATTITQARERLNQPAFYGNLVAVTGDGEVAVLWFQDKDGRVRNAVVEKPGERLYVVHPTAIESYEFEEHR